jgi:hypothetical protein
MNEVDVLHLNDPTEVRNRYVQLKFTEILTSLSTDDFSLQTRFGHLEKKSTGKEKSRFYSYEEISNFLMFVFFNKVFMAACLACYFVDSEIVLYLFSFGLTVAGALLAFSTINEYEDNRIQAIQNVLGGMSVCVVVGSLIMYLSSPGFLFGIGSGLVGGGTMIYLIHLIKLAFKIKAYDDLSIEKRSKNL